MPRQVNFRVGDDERDIIRFIDERQDPLKRGSVTRDIKYCIRFTMAHLKKNDLTGYDFERLSDMNPDRMNVEELRWFIALTDKASRHIRNNPNIETRLNPKTNRTI